MTSLWRHLWLTYRRLRVFLLSGCAKLIVWRALKIWWRSVYNIGRYRGKTRGGGGKNNPSSWQSRVKNGVCHRARYNGLNLQRDNQRDNKQTRSASGHRACAPSSNERRLGQSGQLTSSSVPQGIPAATFNALSGRRITVREKNVDRVHGRILGWALLTLARARPF